MTGPKTQDPILIEVNGTQLTAVSGDNLLQILLQSGIVVQTACLGQGICHLCRVDRLPGPDWPAPTAVEMRALGNAAIAHGKRLSCQVQVTQPIRVSVQPPETLEERRARRRRRP